MKHFFTLTAMVLFVHFLQAQIALEENWTYPNYYDKVTLTAAGEKYYSVNYNGNSDSIFIYNYDGTLFKQITLPAGMQYTPFGLLQTPSQNYTTYQTTSISDELFNSDALIEVLASEISNNGTTYHVVNEQGSVVYTFPDSTFSEARIFKYNNAYKLALTCSLCVSKVYALPGTLPCNSCDVGSGIIQAAGNGVGKAGIMVYPNPFSQLLTVQYNLGPAQQGQLIITNIAGQQLETMQLSSQTNEIQLNTANLPKGIVILSMSATGQGAISKKLVKIE